MSPSPTPSNIIWITTDHMRYDCIGAHGNSAMHTPNLDRLVENGVSFNRCYANNPVCMPSRCSFMSGCYPQQTGVMTNGQELDPAFYPTVARCFAAGGYRTAQIGKLHFENHEDHDLDPRPRNSYGFQVFQLSEEPGCYEDAYRTWLQTEYPDLVETFTVLRPSSPQRLTADQERMKVLEAPWEASHSGWVATQACRYLATWARRPEPQFLHLGFYAPHPPLNPTSEMFAPYDQAEVMPLTRSEIDWNDPQKLDPDTLLEYRRHFYAMVTGVDMAVGRILTELEEKGMLEDTLIVFCSDHGDTCGDHGRVGKGPDYYESIMRVPLIFHWPRGLSGSEGRKIEEKIEMVDVLPTLLNLANLSVPAEMQGNSYAEALRSGTPVQGREDVYAVHAPGHIMLRTDRYKYIRYNRKTEPKEVLYDLHQDPDEFVNVVEDHGYQDVLTNLRHRALTRTLNASDSIQQERLRF